MQGWHFNFRTHLRQCQNAFCVRDIPLENIMGLEYFLYNIKKKKEFIRPHPSMKQYCFQDPLIIRII